PRPNPQHRAAKRDAVSSRRVSPLGRDQPGPAARPSSGPCRRTPNTAKAAGQGERCRGLATHDKYSPGPPAPSATAVLHSLTAASFQPPPGIRATGVRGLEPLGRLAVVVRRYNPWPRSALAVMRQLRPGARGVLDGTQELGLDRPLGDGPHAASR